MREKLTVVIHLENTDVAVGTMVRPRRLVTLTRLAPPRLARALFKFENHSKDLFFFVFLSVVGTTVVSCTLLGSLFPTRRSVLPTASIPRRALNQRSLFIGTLLVFRMRDLATPRIITLGRGPRTGLHRQEIIEPDQCDRKVKDTCVSEVGCFGVISEPWPEDVVVARNGNEGNQKDDHADKEERFPIFEPHWRSTTPGHVLFSFQYIDLSFVVWFLGFKLFGKDRKVTGKQRQGPSRVRGL